ncbi:MAG: hypothetical protein N2327_05895 [Caldimicrobium sp.]|nr:hypothetical protein [Caldimicrobium sp.]MCX7873943.1 hypothetical protein [Caldimicrobium sp.]MDW8094218.1 hypothetical protein [Caldimicrobium sp.]
MSLEKISLTIRINKPPSEVFDYLKSIERRLKLNPSYKLVKFEKLSEGPIQEGTQYRITAETPQGIISYYGIVKELKDNERMVTEDTSGKLRITMELKPIPQGTLLSYTEEFELPPEILLKEEESNQSLFQSLLQFIFKTGGFCQDALLKKKEKLLQDLTHKAQLYLQRIKEDIEKN